jgi:hypothetical protein
MTVKVPLASTGITAALEGVTDGEDGLVTSSVAVADDVAGYGALWAQDAHGPTSWTAWHGQSLLHDPRAEETLCGIP